MDVHVDVDVDDSSGSAAPAGGHPGFPPRTIGVVGSRAAGALEGECTQMIPFLWVCVGGALGSGARYLVSTWAAAAFGAAFPFGTLIVNVAGSFLIAFIMRLALATELVPPLVRLFLTTGILGGFTTYSTFNYETLRLLDEGSFSTAAANLALTVGGCLVAGLAGLKVGGAVSGWAG